VLGVRMMDLRVPFVEGESVSVFSQKHGSWFPARIHTSRCDFDRALEYDVLLEDLFDDYLETYVKSELQKDLERYSRGRGDSLTVLKKIPSKRLRRRYNSGDRVRVYRGADQGFVEAEVDYEEDDEKPEMEDADGSGSHGSATPPYATAARSRSPAARSRSPSPSPAPSAQGKAGRYRYGGQRHAIVVVRRIGLGSSAYDLPQEKMRLPEYVLRRRTASRSEYAPPARRSYSSGGGAPRRAPMDQSTEEDLVN